MVINSKWMVALFCYLVQSISMFFILICQQNSEVTQLSQHSNIDSNVDETRSFPLYYLCLIMHILVMKDESRT